MYIVKFYTGDYRERQDEANRDRAVCYVEHHFNSCSDPDVGYTVVVVGSNASRTSREWGKWYASAVAREFGTKPGGDGGIKVGGFNGRGNANIVRTKMPAILVEPLFASNPNHAEIIRSGDGREKLAKILADSVRGFFPDGGLVAFSVGHKYKRSNPRDCGARVYGGGTEADYSEMVLVKAKEMLETAE
jgi:N-acetylmuramoyl-L-alanine amidase